MLSLERLVVLHRLVLLAGQLGDLLLNVLAHLGFTFSILYYKIFAQQTDSLGPSILAGPSVNQKLGMGVGVYFRPMSDSLQTSLLVTAQVSTSLVTSFSMAAPCLHTLCFTQGASW